MINSLVNKSFIRLGVVATDREEAIQKAATPLVDAGMIEQRYIEAIIRSMKDNGPYFVLLPHVALPHARPEEGAIGNALGIAALKEPVVFGNESNDPVKYIFTLSAIDDGQHLESLAQLSQLLDEPGFFEVLDRATDPQEVIDYLESK